MTLTQMNYIITISETGSLNKGDFLFAEIAMLRNFR